MSSNDAVAALRQQIDRKYSEAINALETLKAYFADSEVPLVQESRGAPAATHKGDAASKPQVAEGGPTTVDRVLHAIANTYKTVDELVEELHLPEHSIRGALYSKFVQSKITKKKIDNMMAFRRRTASDSSSRRVKGEGSVADLVRDHLSKHPEGQTSGQIHAAVAGAVTAMGGSLPAIGAALYNMKKRGKALHDEVRGTYVLAKQPVPTQPQ